MLVYVCPLLYVWRPEVSLWESILFFHYVSTEHWTWVVRFGGKCLYPLKNLGDNSFLLFFYPFYFFNMLGVPYSCVCVCVSGTEKEQTCYQLKKYHTLFKILLPVSFFGQIYSYSCKKHLIKSVFVLHLPKPYTRITFLTFFEEHKMMHQITVLQTWSDQQN